MREIDEVEKDFKSLHPQIQHRIKSALMMTRHEYVNGKSHVSFPQFFYACNTAIFKGVKKEDIKLFVEIDEVQRFLASAMDYLMDYIKKRNK